MKTKQLINLSTLALAITFTSCKKNDPAPAPATTAAVTYSNGLFITNEGPFGSGTGTVSYYNRINGKVSNDIFQTKNSYPLGNLVQSMEIFNGKGYIVVNNSGKVETVDSNTFASNGAITGLTQPRYFLGIDNNRGYISEWGTGGVAGAIEVVDLSTKTIISTIATGKGAEEMVKVGNMVYVACSGGIDNDSVVTVINTSTNTVVTNIKEGANPKSIKVDANGKIWVLCGGQWDPNYTTLVQPGKLARIDASTNTVDLSLPFTSTTSQPTNLVFGNKRSAGLPPNSSKTILYYSYNGNVYSQPNTASTLSTIALISRNFYGFGIDPTNDYFYGTDAENYTSNGKVIRYNSSGIVIDSIAVGVIPGNFCFK